MSLKALIHWEYAISKTVRDRRDSVFRGIRHAACHVGNLKPLIPWPISLCTSHVSHFCLVDNQTFFSQIYLTALSWLNQRTSCFRCLFFHGEFAGLRETAKNLGLGDSWWRHLILDPTLWSPTRSVLNVNNGGRWNLKFALKENSLWIKFRSYRFCQWGVKQTRNQKENEKWIFWS